MASDTHTSSNRNRWQTVLVLALLTVIAYLLRTVGASSSVSYLLDTQLVRQALEIGESVTTGEGFDPTQPFKYPLTLSYYLLGVFGAAAAAGFVTGLFDSLAELERFLIENRAAVHLLAVYAFNLISVLLVPALYFTSRALQPRHTGYLAACMGAFNLLLVQFGHHPRPHVPLATLSFIAVALLGYSLYDKRTRILLLAACSTALTVGTLQNGIVILAAFLAAYAFRPYDSFTNQYNWRELFAPKELSAFGLLAALTLLLYPSLLSEYGGTLLGIIRSGNAAQLGGGSHPLDLSMFSFRNIPQFAYKVYGYQPLLALLLIPSWAYFAIVCRRRLRLLVVVSVFPLVNLLVWMLFQNSHPRILAVLSPFMIFTSAYMLEDLTARLSSHHWKLTVFAIVLLPMAVNAFRLVYVLTQADSRTMVTSWIEENVEEGSTILTNLQFYDLYPTRTAIARQQADYPGSLGTVWRWLRVNEVEAPRYNIVNGHLYLPTQQGVASLVQQQDVCYIIVASSTPRPGENVPLWDFAEAHGQLIYGVTPSPGPMAPANLPEDLYSTAWKQIWRLKAPGPVIRVYRLDELEVQSATSRTSPVVTCA